MLLFLACVSPDEPTFGLSRADEPPTVLVFNNSTEPEYLDPTQATGHPDGRIIQELFDGLTEYDPVDLSPRPNHATSWETHPDGRGYTFHLRGDAVWTSAIVWPPRPDAAGSQTPRAKAAATAASTAFPPASSIRTPASVAR